jgi:hypothetical protein
MTQVLECLPNNGEDLSSNHSTTKKQNKTKSLLPKYIATRMSFLKHWSEFIDSLVKTPFITVPDIPGLLLSPSLIPLLLSLWENLFFAEHFPLPCLYVCCHLKL